MTAPDPPRLPGVLGVNPIRKRRTVRLKNPYGGYGVAIAGYWFAVCPTCGDEVKAGMQGFSASTRKTAKDALHRHVTKEHAA